MADIHAEIVAAAQEFTMASNCDPLHLNNPPTFTPESIVARQVHLEQLLARHAVACRCEAAIPRRTD